MKDPDSSHKIVSKLLEQATTFNESLTQHTYRVSSLEALRGKTSAPVKLPAPPSSSGSIVDFKGNSGKKNTENN